MTSKRITVILSSLNHGRFIAEAIQSVLDQTLADFEFFIIDDCSEDDSWEIIQSFDDPRITAIRNPVRSRGAFGFNEAIRHRAKGEFIAIHHSDDVWLPTKLERQLAFLDEHPEVGAVFTRVSLIDDDGEPFLDPLHDYQRIFNQPNRTRFEWLRFFFLEGNCLCHPTVVARRQMMTEAGLYDRRLGQIPDFDLWMRMCLRSEIHIIDQALTMFRVRADNANQSGETADTFVRLRNEWPIVLGRLLAIESEEAFFAVFPEMRSVSCPAGNNLRFLTAMRAIRTGVPFKNHFGIGLLYQLMADESTANELKEKYEFGYVELIEKTGQIDPFQGVEVAALTQLLRARQRDIVRLQTSIKWLWRLLTPVRSVWRFCRRVARRE